MAEYVVTLPTRPKAKWFGQNSRAHWATRRRAALHLGMLLKLCLRQRGVPEGLWATVTAEQEPVVEFELSCHRGPIPDSDNAQGVLKSCRDDLAKWLAVDDAARGPVQWRYRAVRGPDQTAITIRWRE